MSALSSNTKSSLVKKQGASASRKLTKLETAEKYRWNRENYSIARRRIDIWRFVLSLLFRFWRNGKKWSYKGGFTQEKLDARRKIQAVWIRENLLNLGPTFIKVGQLFSTRADLFPAEYVDELSKLQDEVPAFTYEQVSKTIEKDLGKPLSKLFRNFDPVPIAAASLGQVHKAKLHSGEEVVVKIQRPGLQQLFTIDLAILKKIAYYFQNHPKWGKGRDWIGIYEECCKILWEETDYLNEGQNADAFRRNFRGENWVKVPRVYWRYTSPRVLTLEYLPGIKISHYEGLEAAGLDRKLLARLGAKAYLCQLLNDGFFHADPHPGNIAVDTDGSLIFYDFGMMGRINTNVREKLMDTLFGIAQKDGDRVVSSLIALGALSATSDMGPVRRSVQFMLDNFMDKPFEEQSIAAISDDLYELAYDQPFRFPATFTFVMRAFSTLEGVGKGLDPDFNFMEVAQPFALELVADLDGSTGNSIIDELTRQATQVSNTALSLPRRIDDTIEKLDRGDIRLRVRSVESDRLLRRLGMMQMATNYSVFVSALVICATLLFINGYIRIAIAAVMLGLVPAWALVRLLRRINRLDKMF
ncbi:ABC1 kinase family protein [Crocosphaera watsonii WH 8501]|uniref:ABC-1 n=6 Tax=Crocosphaera watsonii TaxID=263511 RepID=Q4C0B0_CROWT|nr:ABC-1 [Crocosphaera watsonii WH 8501]EHJ11435.1 Ubiquinone biosynthesis monooxygenase UbiB [Crocosphaera watsonii WH 0003]CCQ52784.1 Ubiquinone biosynthesis monooxygenase UbiB [Crocosphaera watsonii WH 8502]CCQ57790.1 Ubiquinone biosynthesis monooxygenase UbiB [Crocosphaera watsonii WH 0005]CCQ63998.1 Ubiquinone biosynthesis monooxygenase UbiB [Crocosphaera watsonii WH 0401]CCQ69033.1 Ubiquinone biosynthesis monooxygenase UbiB [Crocosphaera watsonii WH 0402]